MVPSGDSNLTAVTRRPAFSWTDTFETSAGTCGKAWRTAASESVIGPQFVFGLRASKPSGRAAKYGAAESPGQIPSGMLVRPPLAAEKSAGRRRNNKKIAEHTHDLFQFILVFLLI